MEKINFSYLVLLVLVFDNLINKLSKKLCKNTFENGILLHGGGWKKMEKIKINNMNSKKNYLKN